MIVRIGCALIFRLAIDEYQACCNEMYKYPGFFHGNEGGLFRYGKISLTCNKW